MLLWHHASAPVKIDAVQKNLHVARVILHAMSILLHGIPPRRVLPTEVFQPAQKQREGTPPLLHYFQEKCQAMKKNFQRLKIIFQGMKKIFQALEKNFQASPFFLRIIHDKPCVAEGGRSREGSGAPDATAAQYLGRINVS